MNQVIVVVAIIFGQLSFVVLLLVWWKTRTRKMELQAEVQTKLIDRLGSTPELVEFLQSSAGRDFVNGVQGRTAEQSREQVLAGVRRSIVLAALGVAFTGMWIAFGSVGFSVPSILFLALGLGNIAATFISLSLGRRLSGPAEPSRVTTSD